MKHIYFYFRNIFHASYSILSIGTLANAQNSTGAFQSINCGVIRENFDLGNGGYTSPVYSEIKGRVVRSIVIQMAPLALEQFYTG